MIHLARFAIAAFVACVATRFLARRASPGWLDSPSEAERARKPQGRGVPTVGGLALLIGLVAAQVLHGVTIFGLDPRLDARAGLVALCLALALGSVDDRRDGGLSPWSKLLGQLLCVAPLAYTLCASSGPGAALLLVCAGLAGMNLANTWDHHDGALATLGLAGFGLAGLTAPGAWIWSGALAGFLPWNLNARGADGPAATPTAYLGDGGSHLVGLGAVLVPGAWPLLLVPALDLVRLSFERIRAGSRPWIGDRRHLSHRLMTKFGNRRLVALMTTVIALPGLLGGRLGHPFGLAAGLGLTGAFYVGSLRVSRTD